MTSDVSLGDPTRRDQTTFEGQSAKDRARQHNGNIYNNYAYTYTVRKQHSDETLRTDQRNEAFLRAAAEGQTPRFKYLLHLGVDIDHSDNEGFTALHHAALSGFEDVVDALREAGADVNAQSLDCGTPLHLAAIRSRKNVVEQLLRFRANVNAHSRLIGSPLHCSCFARDVEITTLLLESFASVTDLRLVNYSTMDRISSSSTLLTRAYFWNCAPLHLTAMQGSTNLARLLIHHKALVDARGKAWFSDSLAECEGDTEDIIFDLVEMTTLHLAARAGYVEICTLLLDNNAKVDLEDSTGCTALSFAAMHGHVGCLEHLLDHGACVEVYDRSGHTAIGYAVANKQNECFRVIASRHANADLKLTNRSGRTALHSAIKIKALDLAETLIKEQPNVDATNSLGQTPLHMAAKLGYGKLVADLLRRGAHLNIQDEFGRTPLHEAVSQAQLEVTRLLLNSGAMKEVQDFHNVTALDCVPSFRSQGVDGETIARFRNLLNKGAVIPTTDNGIDALSDGPALGATAVSEQNSSTNLAVGSLQNAQQPHHAGPKELTTPACPPAQVKSLNATSGKRICNKCKRQLTGRFVRALNAAWHLECFTCYDCGKIVASKFFPMEPAHEYPLCKTDCFRRLDLLCHDCGEGLEGSYVTALGHKYHVEHFRCCHCQVVLDRNESYYEHEGKVYCQEHYSELFAQKCNGCGAAILEQFVATRRNKEELLWHPDCHRSDRLANIPSTNRE